MLTKLMNLQKFWMSETCNIFLRQCFAKIIVLVKFKLLIAETCNIFLRQCFAEIIVLVRLKTLITISMLCGMKVKKKNIGYLNFLLFWFIKHSIEYTFDKSKTRNDSFLTCNYLKTFNLLQHPGNQNQGLYLKLPLKHKTIIILNVLVGIGISRIYLTLRDLHKFSCSQIKACLSS